MKGIVVKSTGSWYDVLTEEHHIVKCKLKGAFRIKGSKTTNPIAVGDKVHFDVASNDDCGLIHNIEPRFNYIIRKSTNLSKQTHIIAANIDQCILIVTVDFPRTSTGFIDRFLLTAAAYHIPVVIVFNKIDLLEKMDEEFYHAFVDLYRRIGYKCYEVSALKNIGVDDIRNLVKGKVNLFAGHSGVGKSALVNAIEPGLNLKTGSISEMHEKGKHTTTFAQMHLLSDGGFLLDTPGIKEFGIVDIEKAEIGHYFMDMLPYISNCRFHNCTHENEPGCAVKNAVEEGKISEERYHNYLNILNNIEEDLNIY